MNKKVLLVYGLILLASIALAYTIGQTITQSQFNSINFFAQSLDINVVDKQIDSDKVKVEIGYTTLQKLDSGDWEVVRRTATLTYALEDYFQCRDGGSTKVECIAMAKSELIQQGKQLREAIRFDLDSQKTVDYASEITASDFDLNKTELNE